jgi:alpha-beta hydrolase superfamily lysophospholipase
MEKAKKRKKKIILVSLISILLAIPLILFPVVAVLIYESIFGERYETASWLAFSLEDYEGLQMERSDFQSEDVTLAGYKYAKANQEVKGVVVIAHGLGGGGHNTYMPFIDYFTSNGYYVFAYDARGNDNSGGDAVEGLPQGIICLDSALHHVVAIEEYQNLPVALFGHSWGGYSVGNVLYMHPEIKAAAIIAGFNESEDLLAYQGQQMAGEGTQVLLPYLKLYERIKFGKEFTAVSALQGLARTEAGIMVVHSKDDTTVPTRYGYDKFHEAFGSSDRFAFVLYEDKGHDYLFYSEGASAYREQLNADYRSYVEDNGREYNAETKEAFMHAHLDKKQCFEPDPVLMGQILDMFDKYCTDN